MAIATSPNAGTTASRSSSAPFYGVAETHGKRLGELDSNEHAIRSRLSTVENRVMELEKRLITPPPA